MIINLCIYPLLFLPLLTRLCCGGRGNLSTIFSVLSFDDLAPIILASSLSFFRPVLPVIMVANTSRLRVKSDIIKPRIKQCINPLSRIVVGRVLKKY